MEKKDQENQTTNEHSNEKDKDIIINQNVMQ